MEKKAFDKNLIFRRQYLITDKECELLSEWQQSIFNSLFIYAHKDLDMLNLQESGNTAILLGFIIDPYNPHLSNHEIISKLINNLNSIDDLIDRLYTLSGRFVMMVEIKGKTYILQDPCGFRTVCYLNSDNQVLLGSQPYIMKLATPIKEGEIYKEFHNSTIKSVLEYSLPVGTSSYDNVYYLVANYYLELEGLKQVRFWPNKTPVKEKLNNVVVKANQILLGEIKALSNSNC